MMARDWEYFGEFSARSDFTGIISGRYRGNQKNHHAKFSLSVFLTKKRLIFF
jgi:hypothetical protein